jgi:hypothetical protein
MLKEYFIVCEYKLKIESRNIESTKVHRDEKGLYYEEYDYNIYIREDTASVVRLFETEEEAKKYLIVQTEGKVESVKLRLAEWESKLKKLKVQ